ncbi:MULTISPECIES: MFS transporter [Paenibacillus]|uniref:MFS transporter n=1 Tax=Paenibacillus TaxID=44249 RepID=UPI000A03810A|nr:MULTISPECIES: MFS transporter [Paenibacillus]MEC2344223.1 MFS transporter [Paenibacillus barengoltzii]
MIQQEGFIITASRPNVLRTNRSYRRLWFARIFTTTSFQMLTVAISWQMYILTHDAFKLGLVGLAEFIPMLLLTLIAGQVADRFERRKIIFICQLVECAVVALLLVLTLGGWIQGHHILIAAAILGASRSFENPTNSAMVPDLVDKEELPQAAAWSASAGQTASIIGPALGGLLLTFGPSVVYTTSIAALLISAFLILSIQVKRAVRKLETISMDSLLNGLRFVFQRKVILGTISLDLFAVLLGGATALLPIFAEDVLHTGSWGLGLLRTAPAVGALLMSLVLTRYSIQNSISKYLFISLAIFGLSTVLFAVSKNLVLSLVALFLIGASDVVSVVIRSTLVQLNTPREMQGRVNAVNMLFIGTSNQLGEFESGTMANWFGAVVATVIGGIGTLVVAVLWMYLFPVLRNMKTYYDTSYEREEPENGTPELRSTPIQQK